MSTASGQPAATVTTLRTWCPACGEVVARLEDGAFRCPECEVTIPKRIIVQGPRPEHRGGSDV